MNKSVQFLVKSSVIAAIYAVATLLLSPLSFGLVQFRFSEVLCALALYTPAAIPGLTVGCFISGMLGPNGIIDAILGGLATLIGSILIYALRDKAWLGLLLNSLINSVVVGIMITKVYGSNLSIPVSIGTVFAGEFVSCFVLGLLLKKYLDKHGAEFLK